MMHCIIQGRTMLFQLRLLGVSPAQAVPVARVADLRDPAADALRRSRAALRLCASLGQFGFKRVMIVTDAVLVKLGLVEPLRVRSSAEGIDVAVHDGITPDPTYPVLQAGHGPCRRTAATRSSRSAVARRSMPPR